MANGAEAFEVSFLIERTHFVLEWIDGFADRLERFSVVYPCGPLSQSMDNIQAY